MREIKFRGYNKKEKKWFYGLIVDIGAKLARICPSDTHGSVVVSKETIGQYTGVKDKTGKEIYEGDLLECMIGPYLNGKVGVMKYHVDRFEVKIYFQGQIFNYAIGRATNYFRVVGNIIENPELLPKVLVGVDYRSFYP